MNPPPEILTCLGAEAAQRVIRVFGGTRLNVPGDPRNARWLAEKVGPDLAMALVFHFGGTRFYVPLTLKGRGAQGVRVDPQRVKRLTVKGWSTARIARRIGCSDRIVNRIRARLKSCD